MRLFFIFIVCLLSLVLGRSLEEERTLGQSNARGDFNIEEKAGINKRATDEVEEYYDEEDDNYSEEDDNYYDEGDEYYDDEDEDYYDEDEDDYYDE